MALARMRPWYKPGSVATATELSNKIANKKVVVKGVADARLGVIL